MCVCVCVCVWELCDLDTTWRLIFDLSLGPATLFTWLFRPCCVFCINYEGTALLISFSVELYINFWQLFDHLQCINYT